MSSISRLSRKCCSCPYVSKCSMKRLESEAYMVEPNLAASAAVPSGAEMVRPMAVKHDYRDIKISEGVTITIDAEKLKEQMRKDFYRKMGNRIVSGSVMI